MLLNILRRQAYSVLFGCKAILLKRALLIILPATRQTRYPRINLIAAVVLGGVSVTGLSSF